MRKEIADFAQNLLFDMFLYLPLDTETEDHRICYRTQLPTSDCTPDPIQAVIGPIVDYATVGKPTLAQCYDLIKVKWPWLTYWFNRLFPTFVGPLPIDYFNFNLIKSVLYLWILQFGPAEIDTWTDIKAAVNGSEESWQDYMAWIDSDAGFSLDGGLSVKRFPEKLLAWLQASGGTTMNCVELSTTLNYVRKPCKSSACSSQVKAYCLQIDDGSVCANS
jgi:hypothetical protein